jgi:hypothetical protein
MQHIIFYTFSSLRSEMEIWLVAFWQLLFWQIEVQAFVDSRYNITLILYEFYLRQGFTGGIQLAITLEWIHLTFERKLFVCWGKALSLSLCLLCFELTLYFQARPM